MRWQNFENRVQTIPDSPERGFELALYYAITGDGKRGKEAIQWGLAHPCGYARQRALILDWAGDLMTDQDRRDLTGRGDCAVDSSARISRLRDTLFTQITLNGDAAPVSPGELLEDLRREDAFRTGSVLYAACEYLAVTQVDLAEDDRRFFMSLPTEFLLNLRPEQVEHPDWMTHIAALALVDLHPNMESSQYLQGWAMEDRQIIRQGPGVGYEFLWADPYLPGIGYQNLDPWVYDPAGRLFARSDWNENACWIGISANGVQEANCDPKWKQTATVFGHMTLIPMTQPCVQVPRRKNDEVAILWKLRPHQAVSYIEDKQQRSIDADATGMWRIPANVEGKLCRAP